MVAGSFQIRGDRRRHPRAEHGLEQRAARDRGPPRGRPADPSGDRRAPPQDARSPCATIAVLYHEGQAPQGVHRLPAGAPRGESSANVSDADFGIAAGVARGLRDRRRNRGLDPALCGQPRGLRRRRLHPPDSGSARIDPRRRPVSRHAATVHAPPAGTPRVVQRVPCPAGGSRKDLLPGNAPLRGLSPQRRPPWRDQAFCLAQSRLYPSTNAFTDATMMSGEVPVATTRFPSASFMTMVVSTDASVPGALISTL